MFLVTPRQTTVISTMLLDTKVLHHTMQDCSTAHTFHYRWFVQLEKTASSLKSDLRHVMVWLRTHSHKELPKDWVLLQRMPTVTTDVLLLRTLCKKFISSLLHKDSPSGGSFFYLNTGRRPAFYYHVV